MINTILLTAFTFFSPIELDSIRTETIDGKTYIIHRVDQKETLFSISRKYGVALIVVVESNPTAGSGLEVGALVRVPYTPNKTVKTKDGIIHKVGQKETLYSISKQYGVTVDDLKSWNTIPTSGIKMGQELLIKDKVIDKVAENKIIEKMPDTKALNTHTVAPSETMYAISRKYGITIQQIKDWNKLNSTDLKPGQVIIISAGGENKIQDAAITPTQPITVTTPAVESKTDLNANANSSANTNTNTNTSTSTNTNTSANSNSNSNANSNLSVTTIPVTETVIGSDEVRETGMAMLLDGTEGNRKYLAHHRSAKPGTIIRVKNNLLRKEVFVRVIGNIPSTEANDVVLRISKSAFDKLGGDGKFPVEVTYFK